jgi:uncharacterized protein DUF6487
MKSCPKCNGTMQRGFVLDNADQGAYKQARWVPGEPEKSFWTGLKVPKDASIPIVTLRCDRCGYLESYATEITGI